MSRKGYNNRYEKPYFIPENSNNTNGVLVLKEDKKNSINAKRIKQKTKRKK